MHKLAQVHYFRKPVPVHVQVLKSQKMVEEVEENIVEQSVGQEVIVKVQTVISGRVALIFFEVEQAT